MTNIQSNASTIPYATPMHGTLPTGRRVWAGFAILFGGLCLVGLGGCFLIGVMTVVHSSGYMNPAPKTLTSSQTLFVSILYICATLSFAGAATLLFIGTRLLIRIASAQ